MARAVLGNGRGTRLASLVYNFPVTPPNATSFDSQHASSYTQGPPRQVPGFDGLHRIMSLLLAERMPGDARVLVLGAGGGLELRTLAESQAGWSFDGVDPSADMLRLADPRLAPTPHVYGFIRDTSTMRRPAPSTAPYAC